jgi:hypothetical protein
MKRYRLITQSSDKSDCIAADTDLLVQAYLLGRRESADGGTQNGKCISNSVDKGLSA